MQEIDKKMSKIKEYLALKNAQKAELEKSLLVARHLDPDRAGLEDHGEYQMLEDAALDAQLKVLEACYDFAKKKSSLDLARRERDDAKEKFEAVNFQELQKSEEVAA